MMRTAETMQRVKDIILIAALTLLIAAVLVLACGASPAEAMQLFIQGIFRNRQSVAEIFVKACPLILTGVGCAVAFQAGFFNIGAEGQFYLGALVGTAVSLSLPLQGPVNILLALVCGFLAGGLLALIAALLKSTFNISEIIVTIMLNYIVINFLGYAVRTFLKDPEGNVPQSAKIDPASQLLPIITSTRFHAGILIAIIAALIMWFLMSRTTIGYELKAVGFNQRAAQVGGISVAKNIIRCAFLSGGLAGIAGVIEVIAIQKKLLEGISASCGYTAVLIALIAGNHPLGALIAALIYATVQVGTGSMQRQLGVPNAIVNILIGAVVLLILGRKLLHLETYGFLKRKKEAK